LGVWIGLKGTDAHGKTTEKKKKKARESEGLKKKFSFLGPTFLLSISSLTERKKLVFAKHSFHRPVD
jgi:hypothetical protein